MEHKGSIGTACDVNVPPFIFQIKNCACAVKTQSTKDGSLIAAPLGLLYATFYAAHCSGERQAVNLKWRLLAAQHRMHVL